MGTEKKKWILILSQVQVLKEQWDLFKAEVRDFWQSSEETEHASCQNELGLSGNEKEQETMDLDTEFTQSQESSEENKVADKDATENKESVKVKRQSFNTYSQESTEETNRVANKVVRRHKESARVKLTRPISDRQKRMIPKKSLWEENWLKGGQKRHVFDNYLLMIQILKNRKKI